MPLLTPLCAELQSCRHCTSRQGAWMASIRYDNSQGSASVIFVPALCQHEYQQQLCSHNKNTSKSVSNYTNSNQKFFWGQHAHSFVLHNAIFQTPNTRKGKKEKQLKQDLRSDMFTFHLHSSLGPFRAVHDQQTLTKTSKSNRKWSKFL